MDPAVDERAGEMVTDPEPVAARSGRRGFTIVEMLVVILVIAVLSGLTLAALPAVKNSALASQTTATMRTIRQGLQLTAVGMGGTPEPVVHPLAATAPTRERFVRGEAFGPHAAGALVQTTGEALEVEDPAWLGSDHQRVLRPSDRYLGGATIAQAACPGLVGVRRDQLRVFGAAPALVDHRRLPKPRGSATLPPPYSAANPRYPDAECRVRIGGTLDDLAADSAAFMDQMLSLGDTFQSLKKLKAVQVVTSGDPIADGRLLAVGAARDRWAPGCYRVGGVWRTYRLRGTSLTDAWGRELLCTVERNGSLRMQSAGRDGVFVVHPGSDGTFADGTAVDGAQLAGDDRDGTADNLVDGGPR